jgi:hypothetical protein
MPMPSLQGTQHVNPAVQLAARKSDTLFHCYACNRWSFNGVQIPSLFAKSFAEFDAHSLQCLGRKRDVNLSNQFPPDPVTDGR